MEVLDAELPPTPFGPVVEGPDRADDEEGAEEGREEGEEGGSLVDCLEIAEESSLILKCPGGVLTPI